VRNSHCISHIAICEKHSRQEDEGQDEADGPVRIVGGWGAVAKREGNLPDHRLHHHGIEFLGIAQVLTGHTILE
jgi:hypothetical protein